MTTYFTATAKDALANYLAAQAPYLSLLSALTLQSTVTAGATAVSVDLAVAVGDTLVFDKTLGTEETKVVSAVSGTGPYTCTITALANGHSSGALISHLPETSATVHEQSVTRAAASWGAPDGTDTITSGTANISVTTGTVGAISLHTAVSGGGFWTANAVPCVLFSAPALYAAAATFQATG